MSLSAVSQSTPDVGVLWWRELLASLRENSLLILFTGLYGLAPLVAEPLLAIPVLPYGGLWIAYIGFYVSSGIGLFGAFAIWYLYHARVRKVPDFQAVAWRRIRDDFLRRERLFLLLPILALWPITASTFSYLKSAIPLLQPFYLDPVLDRWDRALHFGIEPWRLLQPLLGYTWITYLINVIYALWFFVFQAVFVLQACAAGDRKRRMQYLLTMALAWTLIGNLAATLMSSAGPCYYAFFVDGPNPYQPLMEYLRGVAGSLSLNVLGHELHLPFTALTMQDILWQSYASGDYGVAKGISAAPSMHLASTWLMWRLAWSMGRTARIAGSAFLLLIFIGSIHLGWHYALDGYLAIAGAWALWRATGWLLERRPVQALLWPHGPDGAARVRS
jgi:hypothetical protein